MKIELNLDGRLNITTISFNETSKETLKIKAKDVREYGSFMGRILEFIGFASHIKDETGGDHYVNTASLVKHLVKSWEQNSNYFMEGKDENKLVGKVLKKVDFANHEITDANLLDLYQKIDPIAEGFFDVQK